MNNTFKAELYKQYTRKITYIGPIIFFIISISSTLVIVDFIYKLTDNFYEPTSLEILIFIVALISSYTIFSISTYIIPIITPVGIFSKDFKNNVIASSIASGANRQAIFISKVLISFIQSTLYCVPTIIGAVISLSIYSASLGLNINSFLFNLFDHEYGILDMFFTSIFGKNIIFGFIFSTLSGVALLNSIAILSVVLCRKFVESFFVAIGFNLVYNIILTIISFVFGLLNSSIFLTDGLSFLSGLKNTSLFISILTAVLILIPAFLKFSKSEY